MSVEEEDLEEVEHKVEGASETGGKTPKADDKGYQTEEKHRLLRMSEISLWLDTYDDIFSDFDPRPYSQRSLSDDFLLEAKKASREKKSGKIELNFLIPADRRNTEHDAIIRKRLHEHFKKHHSVLQEETRKVRRNSILAILAGMAMMMAATYISTKKSGDFVLNMFLVVLEPGGWFITWFALEQLFYSSKQKKADLDFYNKMSRSDISFTSY
jgi:hypothetical protein